MTLTQIWSELERDAPREGTGRIVRRIHPESPADLYVALELHQAPAQHRRTLELHLPTDTLDSTITPPGSTRQVTSTVEERPGQATALVLALEDPEVVELFSSMCADVAAATATASTKRDAVTAWAGRFTMWRRMLDGGPKGLSGRRQQGLFAELLTLRDHLAPPLGFDEAVIAWTGPDGAPRDFETRGVGIEVKSSAANEPQIVTINGERQLDDDALKALFLVHHSIEAVRDTGETLAGIVAELRASGETHPEAGTFDDRLLQCGYHDSHAPIYDKTGYRVRRTSRFRVAAGFPRITEQDLPDGVGAITYSLAIDACRDFEIDEQTLQHALGPR